MISQEDVPAWFLRPVKEYEQNQSAKEGMKFNEIVKARYEACQFIAKICHRLRFPLRTTATSQLYFHLFYANNANSMKVYPPLDIALTAVFVACKAEETVRKIREILAAAFIILNPGFRGAEVEIRIVEEHRRKVTQYEDLVLEAIKYNFTVTHGYKHLLEIGRHFKQPEAIMKSAFEYMTKLYQKYEHINN